jgi:hypothetical protein
MALKLAEVVSPPKAEEVIGVASNRWSSWIEQLLCALGLHDFRLVESVSGFVVGGRPLGNPPFHISMSPPLWGFLECLALR